jgi:hypothetical protein
VRAITSTPRMIHEPEQQQPADDGPQPAKVFEDHETGQWRVEGFDDDGHSEVEIFTRQTARRDALR